MACQPVTTWCGRLVPNFAVKSAIEEHRAAFPHSSVDGQTSVPSGGGLISFAPTSRGSQTLTALSSRGGSGIAPGPRFRSWVSSAPGTPLTPPTPHPFSAAPLARETSAPLPMSSWGWGSRHHSINAALAASHVVTRRNTSFHVVTRRNTSAEALAASHGAAAGSGRARLDSPHTLSSRAPTPGRPPTPTPCTPNTRH